MLMRQTLLHQSIASAEVLHLSRSPAAHEVHVGFLHACFARDCQEQLREPPRRCRTMESVEAPGASWLEAMQSRPGMAFTNASTWFLLRLSLCMQRLPTQSFGSCRQWFPHAGRASQPVCISPKSVPLVLPRSTRSIDEQRSKRWAWCLMTSPVCSQTTSRPSEPQLAALTKR